MKKLISALAAVILIPLMIALYTKEPWPYYEKAQWEPPETEGVSVQVNLASPSSISLTLSNFSDADVYFWVREELGRLQSLREDGWYWVMEQRPQPSALEAPSNEQIARETVTVPSGETLPLAWDWSNGLGALPSGTYRLVLYFDRAFPPQQTLTVWCDFEITDAPSGRP